MNFDTLRGGEVMMLLLIAAAFAADVQFTHQGRLLDSSGAPLEDTDAVVSVRLLSGASPVHTETFSGVPIESGFYTVVLGTGPTLDSSVLSSPPLSLEVTVNGALLSTTEVLSVPHAAFAAEATLAHTIDVVAGVGTCDLEGQLVYDTVALGLRVCVGGEWRAPATPSTIVANGSSRGWSDGTYASSCDGYRNPTNPNRSYDGAVGDGTYSIDTGSGPFPVACDMTTDGGGWTRVVAENYDSATSAWNDNVRTTCGPFGNIHGGYNEFGAAPVVGNFALSDVTHAELRLTTTFIKIDSWDNEVATMAIDGSVVWTDSFFGQNGQALCGNPSSPEWLEESRAIDVTVAHSSNTVSVTFDENLSSPGVDESYGHDDLEIWVR